MSGKLKKIFSLLAKKKIPLLVLVCLGFLLIPSPASALFHAGLSDVWESIKNLPITLPAALIATAAFAAGVIFAVSSSVAIAFLVWVLSPGFTQLSFTNVGLSPGNPAWNTVIDAGLKVTQGFVNMVLVLVLVYIALATILRLAGYETKKLLVTFVIVALLVNFAPVLVGLIVDAANISMQFFLDRIQEIGGNLSSRLTSLWNGFSAGFFDSIFNKSVMLNKAATLTLSAFLYLASTIIYFLFGILFIVRYMVIWILVILAPIAFASYILPSTKRIWTLWWNTLIQWSVIGITAAFFLYLAELFSAEGLAKLSTPGVTQQVPIGGDVGTIAIGAEILQPLAAIIFLILAFVFALATSAMGSSAIIRATMRGQRRIGRLGARGAWKGARLVARGALIRPAKYLTGRPRGSADTQRTGRWAARTATHGIEKIGLGRYIPKALREAGETRGGIEAAQQGLQKISSQSLAHGLAHGSFKGEEGVAAMAAVLDRNDSQDLMEAFKKTYGAKTDEELFNNAGARQHLGNLLTVARNAGMHTSILRKDPRLARATVGKKKIKQAYKEKAKQLGIKPGKLTREQKKEARYSLEVKATEKAVRQARDQHIGVWEPEVLQDRHVQEAFMQTKKAPAPYNTVETKVKEGQKTFQQGVDIGYSEFVDKVAKGEIKQIGSEKINDAKKKEYKSASKKDAKAPKKLWDEYGTWYRSQHQGEAGYHDLMETVRFRDRGWDYGTYLTEKRRGDIEKDKMSKPGLLKKTGAAVTKGTKTAFRTIGDVILKKGSKPKTGKGGKGDQPTPSTGKGGKRGGSQPTTGKGGKYQS